MPKFKVGDKVRINITDIWYSASGKTQYNGQEFKITEVNKPRWPGDEFIYCLNVIDHNRFWLGSSYLWSEKELELVKPKFDINDYPGMYVMHCKTQEQAEIFTMYLHKNNRTWWTGRPYTKDTNWESYKYKTCYNFNENGFSQYNFYKNKGYTILEFKDFDWSDFEMKKEFTKKDLKNGDMVKLRNGTIGIILLGIDCLLTSETGGYCLKYVENDLTHDTYSDRDIIAVYRTNDPEMVSFRTFEHCELVYERKEVEEMTLAEVCKALGKEIKIVKE